MESDGGRRVLLRESCFPQAVMSHRSQLRGCTSQAERIYLCPQGRRRRNTNFYCSRSFPAPDPSARPPGPEAILTLSLSPLEGLPGSRAAFHCPGPATASYQCREGSSVSPGNYSPITGGGGGFRAAFRWTAPTRPAGVGRERAPGGRLPEPLATPPICSDAKSTTATAHRHDPQVQL